VTDAELEQPLMLKLKQSAVTLMNLSDGSMLGQLRLSELRFPVYR
jgi:hypothetical protein